MTTTTSSTTRLRLAGRAPLDVVATLMPLVGAA